MAAFVTVVPGVAGRGWCALAVTLAGLAAAVSRAGTPVPFTEEAQARGIDYLVQPMAPTDGFGRGVAFVDLDNDGDPDLVVLGRSDGVVGVFENDGSGFFTDRSLGTGIPAVIAPSGITAADYDADGDLDLYISCFLEPNVLLRNDGGFVFTDVTTATFVGDAGAGTGCAWADYDGDGRLDLYLPNYTYSTLPGLLNRLYRNNGKGGFVDMAKGLGLDDNGLGFQAIFFDYDRDGDADLYLSNDKAIGCLPDLIPNRLWENVGGAFIDVTDESGTAACIDSMGVAVGDFDGNGFQDLYCTNTPLGNPLFLNQGDGTFLEFSGPAGVASYAVGWGAIFFDYDNDGYQELYVCNMDAPNRLYDHDGTWPAEDVAPALAVGDPGISFCVAMADVDRDGDLDLVLQNAGANIRLLINHEGERRRWMSFDVRGVGANRFAVGAEVVVCAGTVEYLREVFAGTSYKSQDEMPLHVGVNDALFADQVDVKWPGGVTRTLTNLPTNVRWTLYHPDLLGDGDGDGDVELDDFVAFVSCFSTPGPGNLQPGCEMMDFDGDGDVDLDDFDLFLAVYQGPLDDCNGNGVLDLTDILLGTSPDQNNNGIPDECEPPPCPSDLDGSGDVGVKDLLVLLGAWGPCPPKGDCPADFDNSGDVGVKDLLFLLGNWGPCP